MKNFFLHTARLPVYMTILFSFVASFSCSGIPFTAELSPSAFDIPMYGKTPAHSFFDSSIFTFPLQEQWSYDASAGFGNGGPIIIGSTMFFGTLKGEFHAINIKSGKRIGYFKTFSPIQGSPALLGNVIVYGVESGKENLFAYRPRDAELAWIKDIGGLASSPVTANDTLYVGGLDGKLYCFDQYGTEQWSYDLKAEIRSTPCLSGGLIYCASTGGKIFALNASGGNLQWTFSTGGAVYAGLTIHDSTLIVCSRDSSLYFLNSRSGELKKKIFIGDRIMAMPSFSDSALYVSSLDGSVTALRAGSGERLWKFSSKAPVNTTPVITKQAVFVGSLDKTLYALSPADGSVLWKTEFPGRIKTTPIVWKNSIFILTEDKNVYCFR